MQIQFKDWSCELVYTRYTDNSRTAIQLIETGTEEPIAMATVNLPDVDIAEDEVAIKDYSENEGMLAALTRHKIVGRPLRYVQSGFVSIPIRKLLER